MPGLDPLKLVGLTVAVSASGALSPGPLTVAAVAQGARGGWRSGLSMALGHMTFELPYVAAIGLAAYYLSSLLSDGIAKYALGAVFGAFIAFFSAMTVIDGVRALRGRAPEGGIARLASGPYVSGLALTALNPFFLLWWLTVGLVLVEEASTMGLVVGLSIMYPSHVWMDYVWLALMASAGHGSRRLLGSKGYGWLLLALAAVMAVAGGYALAQLV